MRMAREKFAVYYAKPASPGWKNERLAKTPPVRDRLTASELALQPHARLVGSRRAASELSGWTAFRRVAGGRAAPKLACGSRGHHPLENAADAALRRGAEADAESFGSRGGRSIPGDAYAEEH